MSGIRLVHILSENWTLTPPRDLRALVRMAQEAEDAGFDAVMVSEHVVFGPGAGAGGLMPNPLGHGWNPLGRASDDDVARLRSALAEAGRDPGGLELVGGTRGRFPDGHSVADLDEALATIPEQVERGFTSICIKPSQFLDDPARHAAWCRDVVARVDAYVG